MAEKTNFFDETGNAEEMSRKSDLYYDKKERDRMRFLLQKASRIIDLIVSGEVPFGTAATVKLMIHLMRNSAVNRKSRTKATNCRK